MEPVAKLKYSPELLEFDNLDAEKFEQFMRDLKK
jgi:hypothetical protein